MAVVAKPGSDAERFQQIYGLGAEQQTFEQPERGGLDGWATPEAINTLYTQATGAQPPAWATPEITQILAGAYDYMQQTGGATLPPALQSALGQAIATPPQPAVQAPAPALPEFDYSLYGLTPEQWASLDPWKQTAMRLMSTGTAAGATTGAVAGIQGGVGGVIGGALFGGALGKLSEKFPGVQTLFDWLDVAVENLVMKPIGTAAYAYNQLQQGNVPTAEQMKAAWTAGEQVFRVNLPNTGQRPQNYMGAQLTPEQQEAKPVEVWGGPAAPLETRLIAPEQQGTNALIEYVDRMNAGETPEALNAEFEQRFGFEGQMTDLAARIFLDPLNVAGFAASKGLKLTGKALKFGQAWDDAFSGYSGPFKNIQEYKATLSRQHLDDLSKIEKWMFPQYTKEGVPKLLDTGKPYAYLVNATPATKAKELSTAYTQNMPGIMGLARDVNPLNADVEYLKLQTAIANVDMAEAARLNLKLVGSPEGAAFQPYLKDSLDSKGKKQGMVDLYHSEPATLLRDQVARLSDAAKVTDRELLGMIEKNPRTALAQLKQAVGNDAAALQALDSMGEAGLTDLAAAFDVEKGMPVNMREQMTRLAISDVEGIDEWGAKYFGVQPDKGLNRWANLIKSGQGLFLLDLSPTYLIRNVVDNEIKTFREGLLGFRPPDQIEAYLKAKLGDVLPYGIGSEALSDTVFTGGEFGKIQEAMRQTDAGLMRKAEDFLSGTRQKIGVISKASGKMEKMQRMQAFVVGYDQATRRTMDASRLPALPAELENLPGLRQAAASAMRNEGLEGLNKIVSGEYEMPRYDAEFEPAALEAGKDATITGDLFDTLGLSEKLRGVTSENAPQVFSEIRKNGLANVLDKQKDYAPVQVEHALNVLEKEGPMGFFGVMDDIAQEYGNQRLRDWDNWQRINDLRKDVSPEVFHKMVMEEYSLQAGYYKQIDSTMKSALETAVKKLDPNSRFSTDILGRMDEFSKVWTDFFEAKKKLYRDYFGFLDKRKDKSEQAALIAWEEIETKLNKLYEDSSARALEIQTARDVAMVDLMGNHYGEGVRASAQKWLDGVRKLDEELYNDMQDFYLSLKGADTATRQAAWARFVPQRKQKIMQREAAVLTGARETWREAQTAKVDGAAAKAQAETARKAAQAAPEATTTSALEAYNREYNETYKVLARKATEREKKSPAWNARGRDNIPPKEGYDIVYSTSDEAYYYTKKYNPPEVEPPAPVRVEEAAPETPEFKKWFSGSKVVDENGQPLRMYHGTTADFEGFSKEYIGKNFGDKEGIYFTSDPEEAGIIYGGTETEWTEAIPGGNIRPVYLKIDKPLIHEFRSSNFKNEWVTTPTMILDDLKEQLFAEANKSGSDGVIVKDLDTGATTAVILDPEQVKTSFSRFAPEPDPIGTAPPGAVDALTPEPSRYKVTFEGWQEEVLPVLNRLEARMRNPQLTGADYRGTKLSADQTRALRGWVEQTKGYYTDANALSVRYGQLAVDQAMLNYNRRYGFDNVLNWVFPYQFWYTRSAMKWAMTAIDKPYWFTTWHRMREMQEEMKRPMPGFPSRLEGKLSIPAPFLPQGWGDTIYVDPLHLVFGFEDMANQVLRPLKRDFSNYASRADYILDTMVKNGEISQQDADMARLSQEGDLWTKVYAQAQAEVEAEVSSPLDFVGLMIGYSLPVQWALQQSGLMKKKMQNTLPGFGTIKSLTSFVTPGGIDLQRKVQEWFSGKPSPTSLQEYYVMRELSNMATAPGADVDAVKAAMLDPNSPLYQEALSRIGKQQATKQLFGSVLWLDFFPEGEQQQRKMKLAFEQAADAGNLPAFFEAYPEYEARMMLRNWDNPEDLLRQFTISSIWDGYNKLGDLEKSELNDQLGDLWNNNFLNKATRSYDRIDTDTLITWAKQLKAPMPEIEQVQAVKPPALEMPAAPQISAYDMYQDNIDALWPGVKQLNSMYYDLPKDARAKFLDQYPQLQDYWDYKYIFLAQHPEMQEYLLADDNELMYLSPKVRQAVIDYRSQKALLWGGVGEVWNEYHKYPKGSKERKALWSQYPELKMSLDWNDSYMAANPNVAWVVKPELFMNQPQETGQSFAEQASQYPDLFTLLDAAAYGDPIPPGAQKALYYLWERNGKIYGSYTEWLRLLLAQEE